MASTLGSLVVSLEGNMAKFVGEMEKASYIAEREAQKTAKFIDGITKSIYGLAAAAGVGLSFHELWSSFKEVTEAESALVKMAVRLNTTTEDLSSMGVMIRKTGMDADSFYLALERMNKNISNAELKVDAAAGAVDEFGEPLANGSRLMDELGLKAEVLNKLPLPEKLMAISQAMKDNIDPANQTRIALELAGRSGGALVIAFKEGPDAIQKWIDRQRELGVITDDMAKRGAAAKTAAGDLSTAWHHFAVELTDLVAPAVTTTLNLLTDLALAARKAPPAVAVAAETAMAYAQQQAEQNQGFRGHGATGSWIPQEVFKTPVRPGPKATGGAGADKSLSGVMNIIDQLEKEYAKFTQGAEAETDAWYQHIVNRIKGIDEVVQDPAQAQAKALELAGQVLIERKKRQEEDYQGWLAESYYDTEAKINNDRQKKLRDYLGNAQKQEEINAVFDLKLAEERSKKESELQGMVKGYYDTLAGASPLMVTQLAYKEQALALEKGIAAATLGWEIIEKRIPPEQADQLRGLLALTNQAKQFNLEQAKWQTQGVMGGLKGFAVQQVQESETYGYKATMDMLKSFKDGFASSLADGLTAFEKGEKSVKLEDIGWKIVAGLNKGLADMFTNQLFTLLSNTFMESLGITMPTMQMSATMAAQELGMGGMMAGNNMIAGATQAAAILSSAGGADGGFMGSMMDGSFGIEDILREDLMDGFFAKGGVFTHGQLTPFARGGLVDRPTLFPMARGYGLMGEAGPEAVMPLARTGSGDLGVRAAVNNSNGPVNIIIETHTKNPMQITTKNEGGGNIRIIFDELLEEAINNGGRGAKALDMRYGARPQTVVR